MIHIILLILKIIGYVLLTIVGLIILLLAIVLLVPIKYNATGAINNNLESLKSSGKITWIFRLIHIRYIYENRKFTWTGRVAWINLDEDKDKSNNNEGNVGDSEEFTKASPEKEVEFVINEKEECEYKEEIKSEPFESNRTRKEYKASDTSKSSKSSSGFHTKFRKINSFFKNIKYTFERICDTINNIWRQKEIVEEFLANKLHQSAFVICKRQIIYLWHHVKPKKIKAVGEFGFDDPSKTGQVLAVLSMFQVFYGDEIQVVPNFEEEIYVADVLVKGKIRLIHLVVIVFRLIRDKNVRLTYKHIKKLEFFNNKKV